MPLGKSVKNVGIVIANVEDSDSLIAMAQKGKVILNCVGPYRYEPVYNNQNIFFSILFHVRFYGEAVVKACVENGASHIDISGEPQVTFL